MTAVQSTETALDNPAWNALVGPHAGFAEVHGTVRRYQPDVAPFAAVAEPDADTLDTLQLAVPETGAAALVTVRPVAGAAGLKIERSALVMQMIARQFRPTERRAELVILTRGDVEAMLELVALTHPGPFAARTIEMGLYLGIKDGERLVAMSGERMRMPGFTEVSAVCVHPDWRGRGYAKVLVSAVAQGIVERGETPFLHVYPDNAVAIATYRALGFEARRELNFTVFGRLG